MNMCEMPRIHFFIWIGFLFILLVGIYYCICWYLLKNPLEKIINYFKAWDPQKGKISHEKLDSILKKRKRE